MQQPFCQDSWVKEWVVLYGYFPLVWRKSIKSYILPLGYNFHPQPDFRKRRDSPSCNGSSDLPWKLFEGCWHSFQLQCLWGLIICVICRHSSEEPVQTEQVYLHCRQCTDDLQNVCSDYLQQVCKFADSLQTKSVYRVKQKAHSMHQSNNVY